MLFRLLTSLVFPHYCPSCKGECFEGEGLICSKCWKCLEDFKAYWRLKDPNLRERSNIAFTYNNLARLLVLHMKFYGRMDIAERLGSVLYERFYPVLKQKRFDAVIPVPLHSVRIRERGFNQSEIIAARLAEKLKVKIRSDILIRVKNTRPQSRLSNQERENNVIGAFESQSAAEDIPEGSVLLVDDVFHTGSTLKGCISALKDIGVKDIRILAAFG